MLTSKRDAYFHELAGHGRKEAEYQMVAMVALEEGRRGGLRAHESDDDREDGVQTAGIA